MVVEATVDHGVYWVRLNRPGKLNSLDSRTLREARGHVARACRDPDVVLVAITGEGRFFSAGIDLSEVAGAKTVDDAARPFTHLSLLIAEILDCQKPVAALVNGPAVAGGAELVLAADYSVAVEDAWLQWPEVRWGLVPPLLLSLAAHRGDPRLHWLAASMERVPAPQAVDLGLLSTVAPGAGEARRALEEVAESLRGAPRSLVRSLLDESRRWKRQGHGLMKRLIDLARSTELIEKARRFLEEKGRG